MDSSRAGRLIPACAFSTVVSTASATIGDGDSMHSPIANMDVADKRRLLAEMLAGAERKSAGRTGPVSFAQRRLWILDSLVPGSCAYNVPVVLRTSTPPDPVAFARALEVVIDRHEVLRTVFVSRDGVPVQRVGPGFRPEIDSHDVSAEPDPAAAADQLVRTSIRRPFDLATGPMLRVLLVRVAPDAHLIALTVHHIVCDGWSIVTLFRELDGLYAQLRGGAPAALPTLPHQYIDYAVWQRTRLSGPRLDELNDFWRNCLDGAPGLLQLPHDAPRPAHQRANGGVHEFAYPRQLREDLLAFAAKAKTTPSVVVLACFTALLQRFCAQDDIVVGVATAGQTHSALQGMIGFFVNTLVMRMDMTGQPSLAEAIQRGHERTLDMFAHQDMPFEKLVIELQPDRNPTVTPIFQVLFNFQTASNDRVRLPNLDADLVPFDTGIVRFDLEFNVFVAEEEMGGSWLYNRELLNPAAVARMTTLLERLIAAAIARPEVPLSALDLFDAADLAEFDRVGGAVGASSLGSAPNPGEPVVRVGPHTVFADGTPIPAPNDAATGAYRWLVDELIPLWRNGLGASARHAVDRRRARFPVPPRGVVLFAMAPAAVELDEAVWALEAGAQLVLIDVRAGLLDAVSSALATEAVDTLCIAPGLLSQVMDAVERKRLSPSIRRVLSTHEPLSVELEARCLRLLPDTEFWSVYRVAGIGDIAARRCLDDRPLGRDVAGRVYPGLAVRIRDVDGHPLPIGAPGRVWVSHAPGGDVATGDLGRFREDGQLELLGPEAAQVLLRQVRVSLGEVESPLTAHRSVRDARVLAIADPAGASRFVAYLATAPAAQTDRAELRDDVRAHAQRLVPGPLVPRSFVFLDALPLTARGTVDSAALREIDGDDSDVERVAPRNDTERLLVDIWRSVLEVDEVGIHDNFFLLGGHSLLAIQLMSRLRQATRIDLPVSVLFRHRTVADLAARVISMSGGAGALSNLVEIQAGFEPVPVVAVHPASGGVFPYVALATALSNRTVYAFEGRDPGPSVTALAERYLDQLPEDVLNGPFALVGWSLGGVVAFEMARVHAQRGGREVPLTLIDSALFEVDAAAPDAEARLAEGYLHSVSADFGVELPVLSGLDRLSPRRVFADLLERWGSAAPEVLDLEEMMRQFAVYRSHMLNVAAYRPPGQYAGPVHLLPATQSPPGMAQTWREFAPGLVVREIDGDHHSVLRNPGLGAVVSEIEQQLKGLDAERGFLR
ncbi:condensation domain-containing protein [Nocardia sp. NPDC057030]|uniref:condensation domain-containing protein n=1 Tax=unclassified Nocardia TaxID=2637762 RepID=UPI00364360F8